LTHVGILGGGNISETHARAARELEGVRVVAVHGQNREKARRLAAVYGGEAYADLEAFLAHRPMEVVLVGSPSGLHARRLGRERPQGDSVGLFEGRRDEWYARL
jgi:UDP-N-acetyl-2-amino-2-deoxyglucuronate dehydrogenase